MIDENDFDKMDKEIEAQLIAIRKRIGASVADYSPAHIEIEIEGAELQKMAEDNPGEPIIIDGKYHFVYIRDNSYYNFKELTNDVRDHPANCFCKGKKVHFYYCSTLTMMTETGRKRRYRHIIEDDKFLDSNELPIDYRRGEINVLNVRLPYCKNCIEILLGITSSKLTTEQIQTKIQDWTNNADEERREKKPEIKSGIAEYSNAKPLMDSVKEYHKNSVAKINATPIGESFIGDLKNQNRSSGYPNNWSKISEAFRNEHKYICDDCGVDCSKSTHLTDAHHVNGDKSDCNYKNLRCLCKYHHTQQDFHGHYKLKEEDMEKLRQLWEAQDIPHDKRG